MNHTALNNSLTPTLHSRGVYNKDKGGWDQQRIEDNIAGGDTHFVLLARPMPLYFLYWSVFAGDDGRINFRKDIYGYDSLLTDKMKDAPPILIAP